MLFKMSEQRYNGDERLVKALDVLFILHADHEQNCSTNAVRSVGSSQVDPYSAVAAGVGALFGPLHGGANEAVLRMLRRIGSLENIPAFIEGVKEWSIDQSFGTPGSPRQSADMNGSRDRYRPSERLRGLFPQSDDGGRTSAAAASSTQARH